MLEEEELVVELVTILERILPTGQIWLMHALIVKINFTFSEYGISRKTFK